MGTVTAAENFDNQFLLLETNLHVGCCIHFMAVLLALHSTSFLVASLCSLLGDGLLQMGTRPRVEVSVRLGSSAPGLHPLIPFYSIQCFSKWRKLTPQQQDLFAVRTYW